MREQPTVPKPMQITFAIQLDEQVAEAFFLRLNQIFKQVVQDVIKIQLPPEPVKPEAPIAPKGERLIDIREVAKMLSVSTRTVWSFAKTGKIMPPIKLVPSMRWCESEIVSWIRARCPSNEEWEKMRQKS